MLGGGGGGRHRWITNFMTKNETSHTSGGARAPAPVFSALLKSILFPDKASGPAMHTLTALLYEENIINHFIHSAQFLWYQTGTSSGTF